MDYGAMTNEELAMRAQAGDVDALRVLWDAVKLLCFKLGKKFLPMFQKAGMDEDDWKQELFLAVYQAVKIYDAGKGIAFTTYLDYQILNQFRDTLDIHDWKTMQQRPRSLNVAVGLDDDAELQDLIPDPNAGKPFEDAEESLYTRRLRVTLEECIDSLPIVQAQVIRRHFFDGEGYAQIAADRGCSYGSTIQSRNSGLLKLKRNTKLLAYKEDILSAKAARHVGFCLWKNRGSIQEQMIEYLDEKGLLY